MHDNNQRQIQVAKILIKIQEYDLAREVLKDTPSAVASDWLDKLKTHTTPPQTEAAIEMQINAVKRLVGIKKVNLARVLIKKIDLVKIDDPGLKTTAKTLAERLTTQSSTPALSESKTTEQLTSRVNQKPIDIKSILHSSTDEEWFDEKFRLSVTFDGDLVTASEAPQRGKKKLHSILIDSIEGKTFQGRYIFTKPGRSQRVVVRDDPKAVVTGLLKDRDTLQMQFEGLGGFGRSRKMILKRSLIKDRKRRRLIAIVVSVVTAIALIGCCIAVYSTFSNRDFQRRELMSGIVAAIGIVYGLFVLVYRPVARKDWNLAGGRLITLAIIAAIVVPNIATFVKMIGDIILFALAAILALILLPIFLGGGSSSFGSSGNTTQCMDCFGAGRVNGNFCGSCRGTGRVRV